MRVAVPVKYLATKSDLQADGVEDLGAAIGLVGRDAHLRHHLEQSLVDRLDVALDDFLVVELLRQLALHGDQRLEGEIGIDRLGAVAGEAGEMVHLARLAGFDDQPDRGAQALADQMMMHRRAGEQRRDRNAVGAGAAVGQDDDVDAVAHGGLGLGGERLDRRVHAGGAGLRGPGGVERARLEMIVADLGDRADLLQIGVGQDRLMHLEPLGVRHPFEVEQVRPRPDDRDEAHDQLLADRVDRRVGHLGEVLLEVGEQELRLVGQAPKSACRCPSSRRPLRRSSPSASSGFSGLPGCSRRPAGDRSATGWRSAPLRRIPAGPRARSGCARATPDRDGCARASP